MRSACWPPTHEAVLQAVLELHLGEGDMSCGLWPFSILLPSGELPPLVSRARALPLP